VELPVGQAHDAFTDDGRLVDPEVGSALGSIVGRLVDECRPLVELSA